MGCRSSRLNELPAVALCRQRCGFLHEAIGELYALSDAHLSYINSLHSLSLSLQLLRSISRHQAGSHQPPPMNNNIYSPCHLHNSCDDDDDEDDLRQIREEEGIPDLEEDEDDEVTPQAFLNQTMLPMGHDDVELEHEVQAGFGEGGGPPDAFQVLLQRASECAMEMSPLLEPRPLPYPPRHAPYYQAFSKMLKLAALPLSFLVSQPSFSKVYRSPRNLELDADLLTRSRGLSSTLHKLHLWEKKLYKEVKAEEKIRVLHDRKCRMLKRLDEWGAEFHKVDATQTSVKNLSTKIKMAIQVVDLISVKINKIRDEELRPQVNELIQGLTRMWECMHECHRNQCEAIREAGNVGWIMGYRKKSGDAHEATTQVEQEVINWSLQFCRWISAQKRYVRAMNNWLLKCLMYEPEEIEEGGLSPGRMGAPRVFVICNRWKQAMERMSEKEVVEGMYGLSRRVVEKWEKERMERMLDKDVEGNGEREEHKLKKRIQAEKKKMVAAFREVDIIYNDDEDEEEDEGNIASTSLQASLQQILEAMERFTGTCAALYQELLL